MKITRTVQRIHVWGTDAEGNTFDRTYTGVPTSKISAELKKDGVKAGNYQMEVSEVKLGMDVEDFVAMAEEIRTEE